MKRENLFLEQLSDIQLAHTKNIVNREINRRGAGDAATPGRPRKSNQSQQMKAVKGTAAKKAH